MKFRQLVKMSNLVVTLTTWQSDTWRRVVIILRPSFNHSGCTPKIMMHHIILLSCVDCLETNLFLLLILHISCSTLSTHQDCRNRMLRPRQIYKGRDTQSHFFYWEIKDNKCCTCTVLALSSKAPDTVPSAMPDTNHEMPQQRFGLVMYL